MITPSTPLEDIPTPDNLVPLFKPITVGRYALKNRAVYAPLTRWRAIGTVPTAEMALYYSQRANPGQLLITEATGVTPPPLNNSGYGYPNTPGLQSMEQIAGWKQVVEAVHAKGAIFFAQLWHLGRASHPIFEDGKQPVSASDVPITNGETYHPETLEVLHYSAPRPLLLEEIGQIVQYFREAARNAVTAGFDGVEIHATNGYLINQFLDDRINKRTDKYGGSVENRCRFCLEVVQAITEEIGSDRVGIRLGAFSGFLDSGDSNPYPLYTYLVTQLNKYNLAYMHFIEARVAGIEDRTGEITDSNQPFTSICNTVVILAGGLIDPSGKELGSDLIREGKCDMVAYGRWALANPDLLKRLKLGAALNPYNRGTFYAFGSEGYTDYPFLHDTEWGQKYFAGG